MDDLAQLRVSMADHVARSTTDSAPVNASTRTLNDELTPALDLWPVATNAGRLVETANADESVRKVCLYTPAARALSPAAEGFVAVLAPWITHWSAGH